MQRFHQARTIELKGEGRINLVTDADQRQRGGAAGRARPALPRSPGGGRRERHRGPPRRLHLVRRPARRHHQLRPPAALLLRHPGRRRPRRRRPHPAAGGRRLRPHPRRMLLGRARAGGLPQRGAPVGVRLRLARAGPAVHRLPLRRPPAPRGAPGAVLAADDAAPRACGAWARPRSISPTSPPAASTASSSWASSRGTSPGPRCWSRRRAG